MNIKDRLLSIYKGVTKPARYLGGEYNQPSMDKPSDATKMCLCFPDVYEIAMSNVGIRILYHMLNEREDCVCERCFMPWVDLVGALKSSGLPLCSIETMTPLADFDVVGFSIQYELCYTNVVAMMDMAGIPLYARDRDDSHPIIIAGGPCMANPEPFAEYFDIMTVGDGEKSLTELFDLISSMKDSGATKSDIISRARDIEGVIVPSMDYPIYEGDKVVSFTRTVSKAVVKDLDKAYYPTSIIVPSVEAVHDRAVLELYRGCANGCRFCQACFFYRPIRIRKPDTCLRLAEELMANTGFEEMSLSSLSTGDYPDLKGLVSALSALTAKYGCRLSLPSLRLDSFEGEFVSESRTNSLTFAPEAGTQRLRNVINKNISEEDIAKTIEIAADLGYSSIKLYFIIGLPTETMEDIEGIVGIVEKIRGIYYRKGLLKKLKIVLSTAVFIPKPATPFQWEGQLPVEEVQRRQDYLKDALKKYRNVNYNWHDSLSSILEAVFAVGDRKLSKVIEKAYQLGCIYDSWSEYFDYDKWMRAFEETGIDYTTYLNPKPVEELLCHEYIDIGVTRRYFEKERRLAYEGISTPSCIGDCQGCGARAKGDCGI
ncbi:MAG: TIGR03960 family B12-binding radical SAM protein [Clostridia bacterium]|nr:TIGR03960 family B12-binding radical SAM protein [Clostridia bacterium]